MKNLMLKQFFFAMLFLLAVLLTPETGRAAIHDFFMVVHCEVGNQAMIKKKYNAGLRPLVNLANLYGIKLTISLSPQWAKYIAQNPYLQYEVKNWIKGGHEFGILHYGLSHKPQWDFYTNETDPAKISSAGRNPADRIGSMTDLINEVNGLLTSPIVLSTDAKQLSTTDSTVDLTPGTSVKYLTGGVIITDDPLNQDVVKMPVSEVVNGAVYWKLSMGYFTTLPPNSSCTDKTLLPDLTALYGFLKTSPLTSNNTAYTFGLGTHPLDFIIDDAISGGCGLFEEWFRFISWKIQNGEVNSRTVSQILDNFLGL